MALLIVGLAAAFAGTTDKASAATYTIPRNCGSQPYACYGAITYSNFADGWVIQNRKAHGCLPSDPRFDDWHAVSVDYQYVNGSWQQIAGSVYGHDFYSNRACYRSDSNTRDQITSGLASTKASIQFYDHEGTDITVDFSCDLQFAGEPHRCYQTRFFLR